MKKMNREEYDKRLKATKIDYTLEQFLADAKHKRQVIEVLNKISDLIEKMSAIQDKHDRIIKNLGIE